jgi:predicted DNA-binding protein
MMQVTHKDKGGRPLIYKEAMKKYSLTLPPSAMEKLSQLAEQDGRSLSGFISILLYDYVQKLEERGA